MSAVDLNQKEEVAATIKGGSSPMCVSHLSVSYFLILSCLFPFSPITLRIQNHVAPSSLGFSSAVSHPSETQMSPAAAQLSEFASMPSINPFLLSISRPLFSPRRRWSGDEIWVDGTNECGCGNRSVKKKYKEGIGSWKDFENSWVTVCRKKKAGYYFGSKYPRRRTCVLIPVPLKMCIVCGLPVNEKLFGYKDKGLMLKNEEIETVNKLGPHCFIPSI